MHESLSQQAESANAIQPAANSVEPARPRRWIRSPAQAIANLYMALGWIIATLSGIGGVLLIALGGYAAISGLGLLVYGGLGGLGLASFGYVITTCLRSVQAKRTGKGLGWFLAIGSGLIGLPVFMSGV